MNLNTAITLLLPTILGASAVAISVEDMLETHRAASARAAQVQNIHDAQMLEAARIAYWLQNGGPQNAPEAELIARGYLKDTWATREKVDTLPIALPATPANALQEQETSTSEPSSGAGDGT